MSGARFAFIFEPEHCTREVTALVAATAAVRGRGVPGPDISVGADVKALLVLRRELDGLLAERLVPFTARDLHDLEGAQSLGAWAAQQLCLAPGEVTALARVGKANLTHPATGALQESGQISARHARVVHAALHGLPAELQSAGDEFLAPLALDRTPSDLGYVAEKWRETVTPELTQDDLDAMDDAQYLKASPTSGGVKLDGWFTGRNAEWLLKGLDRFAKPTADDIRDADQRRADALALMARIAAGADLTARDLEGTGHAPADLPKVRITMLTDVITMQRAVDAFDELTAAGAAAADALASPASRALPGWLPAAERDLVAGTHGERTLSPMPWRELLAAVCDGDIQRLVLDPASAVLDLGRAARLFSTDQRRAIARGGRLVCQWRRCKSPWVEAHHRTRWVDGGHTNHADGLLLCSYHHTLVHMGWTLTETDNGYKATAPPDWAERRRHKRRRKPRAA